MDCARFAGDWVYPNELRYVGTACGRHGVFTPPRLWQLNKIETWFADMKSTDSEPDDARLGALLREARTTPTLPPRFQENVWKRIERAEKPEAAIAHPGWLDALATWLLRPRLAFAVAAVLVLMGVGLGWNSGERLARSEAQARYLAVVAPNSLH